MAPADPPRAPDGYDPDAFPRVAVTVDVVVLTLADDLLQVVLIERGEEPYRGAWALPGGFIRPDEKLADAAARELREETGVEAAAYLEQFGAYGDPKRDPRMRVVTVAYLAILRDVGTLVPDTDASRVELVPVQDVLAGEPVRALAFDHRRILEDGVARAREKLASTSLATAFIGPEFTLTDLRNVYEAAWGVQLDPGNFRRKVLSTDGFVEPTGRRVPASPEGGKPAETYTSEGIVLLSPPLQPAGLIASVRPTTAAYPPTSASRSVGPAAAQEEQRVWCARIPADPKLQALMLNKGVLAMGGEEPSGLKRFARLGSRSGAERSFRERMQIGDYVLAPLADRRVAIGRVRGEYRPRAQASDPRLRHTRRVDWLRTVGRADLPPELLERVDARGALGVVEWAGAAQSIEALLGDR